MIGFERKIGSVPALVLETLALVLKDLPRNFPNRCASKIAQGRFWKLAKKSIEDRCKKISQPMRVEIVQGRFWKLAKKSIEDRCKKNSQPKHQLCIIGKSGASENNSFLPRQVHHQRFCCTILDRRYSKICSGKNASVSK